MRYSFLSLLAKGDSRSNQKVIFLLLVIWDNKTRTEASAVVRTMQKN